MVRRRYRALAILAFLFQVLAWITLVLAILAMVGIIAAGSLNIITISAFESIPGVGSINGIVAGVLSGIIVLIGGIFNFIILLAISDLLYTQIDVEYNTRMTAEYLRQITQMQLAMTTMPPGELPLEPYSPAPAEVMPVSMTPDVAVPADSTPTITVPTQPADRP